MRFDLRHLALAISLVIASVQTVPAATQFDPALRFRVLSDQTIF